MKRARPCGRSASRDRCPRGRLRSAVASARGSVRRSAARRAGSGSRRRQATRQEGPRLSHRTTPKRSRGRQDTVPLLRYIAPGTKSARQPVGGMPERSLVRPPAPSARGRALAPAVRRALFGFLLRVLLAPEDDLAVLGIDEDGVALLEFSGQHLLRERVDDEPLDRALDRARAVDRVEALLG